MFISQLVREAITRTIIVKRIIYGRWGTRFFEGKEGQFRPEIELYDATVKIEMNCRKAVPP